MPYKRFLKFCIILIPVPAALVLIFYILLPQVAETVVMHRIEGNETLSGLEFDISHIGPSGIHIRDIQKGEGFKADSLFIGYSLESLTEKRVERIAISGLRLDIDSFDAGNRRARQKEFDLKALLEPVLPYMGKAGSIEVTNSALNMNVMDQSLHIPMELWLDFDTKQRKMVLSGHAFPYSQKVKITAAADFNGNQETVTVRADDFMLGHLAPFVSRIDPALSVSGKTDIRIAKQAGENIRLSVSKVQIEKPARLRVENLEADIAFEGGNIDFSGIFSAKTPLVSPVRMKVRGNFKPADGNRFSLYAENRGSDNWTAEYKDRPVVVETPRFSVQINSVSSKLTAFCDAGFSRLAIPSEGIELNGAKLHVPVRFPFQKDGKAGSFGVSKCLLPGGAAVKVTGTVRQTRTGADIKGSARVLNVPALECRFSGTADADESGENSFVLKVSTKQTKVNETTLKPFVKDRLDGVSFEALASAEGEIRFSGRKLDSNLTVDIQKGHLAIEKIGLEMRNIETTVGFDDVLGFETRPARTVRVEKISMKKLVMENVRVVYTIESPTSLLVENANFKWCGGSVSAESFRIKPDKKSYDLVLYCDRLKLAGLLETVADFEATGEGTVSGRIPVRFDGGDISFQDAFLFTSPGAGGHISLKNSSIITKGIPEDTARYTQMDLAREALKEYEYKWAKLLFDTQGEKLHVKLRFDGKPADVLPFEYNRELGRFSRVEASSRGSRFQGIKIDVNLTLPFNQVLKYGKELDKLF
ncbi:MAG: YdbH domain-containing protein [Desulfarculaceae bacterium]|nr:YdbH domain-containing protein [Desulfarculaceae bacterium]